MRDDLLCFAVDNCCDVAIIIVNVAVDSRQRHENRADKWAIRRLIPAKGLDIAVAEGHTELWDLADYFGVTEELMRKAVCLYTHGNLATELYF